MDAQSLFREGVLAIRDKQDVALARRLLMESLRLEPNNEMAWLWLCRTTDQRDKQLQCVERALRINPANRQALELKQKLLGEQQPLGGETDSAPPATASAPPTFSKAAPTRQTSDGAPAVKPIKTDRLNAAPQNTPPAEPPSGRPVPAFYETAEIQAFFADPDQPAPADWATAGKPTAAEKPTSSLSRSTATFQPLADALPDDEAEKPRSLKIAAPAAKKTLSAQDQKRIKAYLTKGDELVKKNDIEGAIEQWVNVLHIRSDQEVAMAQAVRHLSRLGYLDDVRELIGRAMEEGTTIPAIYLTAIDLARRDGDTYRTDELREQVVRLPLADDKLVTEVVEQIVVEGNAPKAIELLQAALENHSQSQKILLRLAQLLKDQGQEIQALPYFNRIVRLGTKTEEGKAADEALKNYNPAMSDRERGSTWLAVRESFGIMVVYVLLAWQDSGLDLLQLGAARLVGIALSLLGGYFLVTATSAPQQQPLAKWLGGKIPPTKEEPLPKPDSLGRIRVPDEPTHIPIIPDGVRYALGLIGAVALILAFALVFSKAIQLLQHPVSPCLVSVDDLLNDVNRC